MKILFCGIHAKDESDKKTGSIWLLAPDLPTPQFGMGKQDLQST